jgi:hypothetical protein
MSVKPASYPADMREKAKETGAHLVTLDINGKFAKRMSVTIQGPVLDAAEMERVWEFYEWLTVGRERERAGRADAATKVEGK